MKKTEVSNILAYIFRNATVISEETKKKFKKYGKKKERSMDFLKKLLLAAAVLCIVGTAAPAMAIDQAETDSYAENVTRKLGRGIINTGFGALELPLKIYKVNFEEGGLAACTYGVLYGVYEVVKREIVGVVEIAAQALCQGFAESGLAAAGHADDDDVLFIIHSSVPSP